MPRTAPTETEIDFFNDNFVDQPQSYFEIPD